MDPNNPTTDDALDATDQVASEVGQQSSNSDVQQGAAGVQTGVGVARGAEQARQDPSASNVASAASNAAGAAPIPEAGQQAIQSGAAATRDAEQIQADPSAAGVANAVTSAADAAPVPAAGSDVAGRAAQAAPLADAAIQGGEEPAAPVPPAPVTPAATPPVPPAPEAEAPAPAAEAPAPGADAPAPAPPPAPAPAPAPAPTVLEEISDAFAAIVGTAEPLLPVRYDFTITEGPDVDLRVRRFELFEELGEPYEIWLDLMTQELAAPTDELLGAKCELLLDRRDPLRSLYGVIDWIEDINIVRDTLYLRVRVVPAFRLLEHEVDTRIFQGMDVKEIVSEILDTSLATYGREFDAETFLKGEYNKRDYCTQFRESNLDFVCRLLEEEGITFTFESDEDSGKEKMVLFDNNKDFGKPVLVIDDDIPIIADRPMLADRESIQSLTWRRVRRPNKVTFRGYNDKAPPSVDEANAELTDAHNASVREIYAYDQRRQIIEDVLNDPDAQSFTGEALDQREPMAAIGLQRHIAESKVLEGVSNVVGLRPGVLFTLGEHWREDLDGQVFLVVAVSHEGAPRVEGFGDSGVQFHNRFRCIPADHEFKPQSRREKPVVAVAQTAEVVGPDGEEIYTDQYGRIRVRFHWDRLSTDELSSCWIRVVQPWGGPGWGFVFIPRIGMEVLINFLDGNPDRPVVVGSLYNGVNMPPYALPDEKTKSVIKTSSSPGGDGYNELTFEDAAGAEQIIVHAQKDYNETVENDHNTTVHHNQTIGVDGNQSTSVGGDQSNSVTGNQTETVKKNVEITVKGTRTHTITKKETVTLQDALELTVGSTERHQVTKALTEQFDDGRTTTVKNGDTETVSTGDKSVAVTAGALDVTAKSRIKLAQDGKHIVNLEGKIDVDTSTDFSVTNGKTTVSSSGGKLALTGNDEISLVCGASSITLKKDGTIEIKGAKKATVGVAASAVDVEPVGITVSGPKISSTAIGIHEVKGALVKIN